VFVDLYPGWLKIPVLPPPGIVAAAAAPPFLDMLIRIVYESKFQIFELYI
jgi:hypothetical protein